MYGNERPFRNEFETFSGKYGNEHHIWSVDALLEHAEAIGIPRRSYMRFTTHMRGMKRRIGRNLDRLGYHAPYWPMIWVLSPTKDWQPPFGRPPVSLLLIVDSQGSHAAPDEACPRPGDFIPTQKHISEEIEFHGFRLAALRRRDVEYTGRDGVGIREVNQRLLIDPNFTLTKGMTAQ